MPSVFPDGVMDEILSRLPVKTICRFRCICKDWESKFKDPHFIKEHLNHSKKSGKFNCFSISNSTNFNLLLRESTSSSASEGSYVHIDSPFKSQLVKYPYLGIELVVLTMV